MVPSASSEACSRAIGLQDDAVLVRLREDRRDDALAEGVVERVVDGRRRDAEAGGGVAIDGEIGREPLVLLVARHVLDLRQLLQPRDAASAPRC